MINNTWFRYLVVSIMAMMLFPCAHAQALVKVPIYVSLSSHSDDPVAVEFAFRVREAIRRSAGYTLSDSKDVSYVWMNLVTVDPDGAAHQSVVSIVFVATKNNTFLGQAVLVVGRKKTEETASGVLAELDKMLN